jgi:hypothetical protein
MRNITKPLATKTHSMNLQNVCGYLKDVIGEYGFDAKTKDLFDVIPYTNKEAIFSKTLVTINYPGGNNPKRCIDAFSITKAGGVYSLCISKVNGVEYINAKVSDLHDRVEDALRALETDGYKEQKETSDIKNKNLERLRNAISKARTAKGKRADVGDVIRHLYPNLRMKTGHLLLPIPCNFTLKFITIIGCIIVEVTDRNGYVQQIKKVDDLLVIIGE